MEKKRKAAIAGGIILAALALFAFIAKTPFIGGFLLVCAILLLRSPKKAEPVQTPAAPEPVKEPVREAPQIYDKPRFKYVEYKLAGVTYKDGRLSRQAALRAIKFEEPPYYDHPELVAEIQEYEGKPAVAIKANGRMLGFIPKEKVSQFMADYPNFTGITDIKITGHQHEDGTWVNGAIITAEVKNDEHTEE